MRHIFYAMVGVGVFFLCGQALVAGPAEQAVQASLASQQRWLGDTAAGWNDFLRTDDLHEQLARGAAADRKVVSDILARYQSKTPGLERPQFAATRSALEKWLAQLPAIPAADLGKAAQDAKAHFAPPDARHIAAAKARLLQAIPRLNQYLARGGAARQAGWRTYLELDRLQAELAKETPDLRALMAIQSHFFQNESGLELAAFVDFRKALRDYNNRLLAVSDKDPKAAYEARLDNMAKLLNAYHAAPRDADAIAIGDLLGYLSNTHQAQPLVKAVRQQYSQPNLYVTASQRLAGAGINRPVDDFSPVHEMILGTDVHGRAHTTGNVSLRTVPSAQRALLEIVMTGVSRSNNVGYNRSVTICTNGYTTLSASKRIFVDANGLQIQPTVAVADTDTDITGISAPMRIVQRIAERRVDQQAGQAQAIASKRAEARLERRIDEQSAADLARASDAYQNKFRRPLLRKDAFPKLLDFATTADSLRVTALHAGPDRLGAPTPAPRLTERYDLAVRVHESLVGNAGETGIGGRTLTDERLAEILKEATGEVPEELQITEDKDPWSITFAHDRPFSVVFDDQTVTLAIHGQRFTRGDREIRKDMLISAKYKLEQQGNGSKLTREGDVVADFVDRERLSGSDVLFKTFIRKKFSALFKPEFAGEGLKLPGRWSSAGTLALRRLESDNGWLVLGWDQLEQPKVAAVPTIGAE